MNFSDSAHDRVYYQWKEKKLKVTFVTYWDNYICDPEKVVQFALLSLGAAIQLNQDHLTSTPNDVEFSPHEQILSLGFQQIK